MFDIHLLYIYLTCTIFTGFTFKTRIKKNKKNLKDVQF